MYVSEEKKKNAYLLTQRLLIRAIEKAMAPYAKGMLLSVWLISLRDRRTFRHHIHEHKTLRSLHDHNIAKTNKVLLRAFPFSSLITDFFLWTRALASPAPSANGDGRGQHAPALTESAGALIVSVPLLMQPEDGGHQAAPRP